MFTKTRSWTVPATALAFALGVAQLTPISMAESALNDSQIQAQLTKSLSNKRFKDVQASVQEGVVTLTGTTDVYGVKAEAESKAHHLKHVSAVRDDIRVETREVSDQVLTQKLAKALAYDRVGYGTTAFNAITLEVQNGEVMLGGSAYGPIDRNSAVAKVSYTPGVTNVVDNINVDPPSPMDDRVRVDMARAIYGFPMLSKYAMDPAKPIRIAVQNGHVTLLGVVNTQADKDVSGIRANGVFGAFSVTNNLQIANQQTERN
jgi:hyperosmotically inducible periplasmic protein